MSRRLGLGLGLGLVVAVVGWGTLNRLAWAAMAPHTGPQPPPPEGLDGLDGATCAGCHPAQAEAWATSAMGQAMGNPGFLADWEAQGRLGICLACHAPFQDQQEVRVDGVWTVLPWLVLDTAPHPSFDAAFQAEGVTCLACHLSEEGQVAVARPVQAPHGTTVVDDLGMTCVRCHQMPLGALDLLPRPIIDTVGEHRAWQEATGRTDTCADCHMTSAHEVHAWRGEGLAAQLQAVDGGWRLTVENVAGHHVPTGETSGALDLWVEAEGRERRRLERLTRVIVGPPWREQTDTTLAPGEVRTWTLEDAPALRVGATVERLVHLPEARAAAEAAGQPVRDTLVLAEARR